MTVKKMIENYMKLIDERLEHLLAHKKSEYSHLIDAMRYSVCAGGKRLRPALMLEFAKICGLDPKYALDFACALEMIHTYSLIHDDLPCMDDDDMRRGRPSCHKAFNETTALLAGDALLTDAFSLALSTKGLPSDRIVAAGRVLSECAGSNGMIAGQVIDLKYENKKADLDIVLELYRLKTGKLLVAACTIGCILGGADSLRTAKAAEFAENIGIAFQIRDDILDCIGNEATLGKPIGSDDELNKSTYVSLVGLEKAQTDVEFFTDKAIDALNIFKNEAENLKQYALKLKNREK